MKPQDIVSNVPLTTAPTQPAATTPQQQVVERLRTAVNVLITVSNNPTVDQLSSAIGLTLLLNKMGKHATAVFSGEVPSTIEFLKPEVTIEKNTDSLRDFIVSLDKSKADKLRYKVEENVVKIFITPYKTSLSEKDLMFSQGDFNVDAVVALGVSEREQLDQAIIAHGRILHDATVITVCAGSSSSTLGAINWQDAAAGSLCEMMNSISDILQPGLLDNQIATAYLTGIVAQTGRFRNEKTTPKIMTIAAQLMAAGANQQLIATSLEQVTEPQPLPIAQSLQNKAPTPDEQPSSLTIEHQTSSSEMPPQSSNTLAQPPQEKPVIAPQTSSPQSSSPQTSAPRMSMDQQGNIQPYNDHADTTDHADKTAQSNESPVKRQLLPVPSPLDDVLPDDSYADDTLKFTATSADDSLSPAPLDMLADPEDSKEKFTKHNSVAPTEPGNILPPVVLPPDGMPTAEPFIPPSADGPNTDSLDNEKDSSQADDESDVEILTLPPAFDNNTLRDIEKTFDSRHIVHDPTSQITEIEEVVHSPHVEQAVAQEPAVVDDARDAVADAIEAAPYNTARPEPLKALNALPVDLPIGSSQANVLQPAPQHDAVLEGLGLSSEPATSNEHGSSNGLLSNITAPTPVVISPSQSNHESLSTPPPSVPPPLLPVH